ncbi:type II toxin-antitoxin system ParD family antitoxin [Mucisphaera calidilacus]|uniref:Antitoxin ParD1 n=1 Tax=Mucisphaera calidilacus TaxID=2527982 RepID=A0A518BXZ3_9BACT|nr:type II toxin-antitoxin system ParD family antitoxin [Mucisphaera calidilacus]QDU71840.1 Antitoxin ParD1 [Mucisphaera calidilacus]
MPTQNVSLSEHFYDFIQRCVDSGRYQNASEVVRAGLRALEQREKEEAARVERLKQLIQEGEEAYARGEYVSLSSSEERAAWLEGIEQEVLEEKHRDQQRVDDEAA